MRSSKFAVSEIVLLFAAFLLASCSGTGDSGTTAAGKITLSSLVLPERVSVVDPKPTGGSGGKPLLSVFVSGAVLGDLSVESDYRKDKTTVYVNERSLDSFRSVNEILCMTRQSRYDAMVNQGPYRAQVDKNLCSTDRSNASNAGQASTDQSSGSTMPAYENWIVESIRSSSASPQIINAWVHPAPNPQETPQVIDARIVITEGSDTAPPYGIFKANFKALTPDRSVTLFKGFLDAVRDPVSGKVLLHFALEDKDSYVMEKATLDKAVDGTTGAGSVLKTESYPLRTPTTTRFDLAYNSTYFLRTDITGTQICLNRTAFKESAWKYGLYTMPTSTVATPGSRINRNSNFQVKKSSPDLYGSIGYWGAWFPGGATVTDGELVSKHDYATNTDTTYTVFKRAGKLKKYTKNNITLADIKSIPLVWFESGTAYLVVWDDAAKVFNKVAQIQSNGSWKTITTTPLNLSALPWVDIMFWSQSLSGSVIVKLPPPTATPQITECINNGGTFDCTGKATSSTPVIYFKENSIFPGDPVPAQLACFERCPDTAALATSNPYRTDILSYQTVTPALATYASYSFSSTTMLLTDSASGNPVTASTTTAPYQNGITSGLLTEPTTTNLNLLACPWNPGSTCAGLAWTVLPEFYIWETGPNTWNQFVTVRDGGGTPIKFDPPLQVQYKHQVAGSKYLNVTFFLEYSGFGDLHGIPGKCVDVDKGQDADCSQGGSNQAIRWVPEFTIPAADSIGALTEVIDTVSGAHYLVKPLEVEQRMDTASALSDCVPALSTVPYTLPSMSSWIDPVIGAEPAITAPPAVVGGVVQ